MIARDFISLALAAVFGLGAPAASALTPLPPCLDEVENGMGVNNTMPLGHNDSGVIVEDYSFVGGRGAAELPDVLQSFYGARAVDCRSGKFVAVKFQEGMGLDQALSATEFLRADVQGEKTLRFNRVQRAAKAVYRDDAISLRETEETCGCNAFFPELRPKALAPYQQD